MRFEGRMQDLSGSGTGIGDGELNYQSFEDA